MAVSQAIKDAAKADAICMLPSLASDLKAELLTLIVERAACLINPDTWDKKQQPALALLICHFGGKQLEAAGSTSGGAAAGPVTSITMGKLAVSFSGPALSEGTLGYGSTEWGLQYLAMRRSLIIPPLTGRYC